MEDAAKIQVSQSLQDIISAVISDEMTIGLLWEINGKRETCN